MKDLDLISSLVQVEHSLIAIRNELTLRKSKQSIVDEANGLLSDSLRLQRLLVAFGGLPTIPKDLLANNVKYFEQYRVSEQDKHHDE